ncbi:Uncharacterised protein [Yersinia pseudotuberculosis]|uniref:Uncharacterized protein n=1 Tax=Yersinia pseudotuberculosis TaxID=633 RepID=A0A380Q9X2_YERPU|nr:Uncharacterised protein [Yersinia pseudotuberculosis]SUP83923.1 Uncharacterised protein [Yersinia pseudotuberculosis]
MAVFRVLYGPHGVMPVKIPVLLGNHLSEILAGF